ncbi:MAG: PAS domain S-box protein [Sphaerochaeta sp.]|nr:PAS domain S-box protein [Sphaerochaeta sp.]
MNSGVERLIFISLVVAMGIALVIVVRARRTKGAPRSNGSSLFLLVKAMREGYLGLDERNRIVDVNDSYLLMTGYRRAELIGQPLEKFVASEFHSTLFEGMKRMRHGQPAYHRGEHRAKDGSRIPIEVSVTALEDGPVAVMCLYRDLREQQSAERESQHSLELLRYVVEHTRSAVAIFDTALRYRFVSEKYLEEYNLDSSATVIGRSHYDVIPDLPERWKEVHQRALAGEVLSEEEDRFERRDGSIEFTRWECRPWYQSDGTTGGMVLYTENITEQKRFEHELLEARDYLSALITRANAPIVVWDGTYTIVRTNPAFASLFGMEVGHLVGKDLELLKPFINPEEYEAAFAAIATKERINAFELNIKQRDGGVKTVLWTAAPVYDQESGDLQAFIAQGQEITERKHIEAENQRQLEMLQRWYAVMVHREERIIELKREVNALLEEAGKESRYGSVEEKRGL